MSLKQSILDNIEKNCVKSELDGKEVYLKKSKMPILGGEWKEIHPPINENGSVNWMNFLFGGWRNLVRLILIFILIGMVIAQFYQNYDLLGKAVDCCNLYGPKVMS